MPTSQEYEEFKGSSGRILVRRDTADAIAEAKGIVFDCDGVLIDARGSYNRAIVETISYFLRNLTVPNLILEEEKLLKGIVRLRSTGGFNNDWDTTYSILLFIFSKLPLESQKWLRAKLENLQGLDGRKWFQGMERISRALDPLTSLKDSLNGVLDELDSMGKIADERGVASVEEKLFQGIRSDEARDCLGSLKGFLSYPGEVGKSLIPTYFNALFYGPELDPRIPKGITPDGMRPLIEFEEVVVGEETLKFFHKTFHGNLGIATGRSLRGTSYTLKGLMNYFKPRATTFTEDEVAKEGKKEITKPHPYTLLKSAAGLECSGKIIYVGDSAEDAIMVKKASRLEDRFIFGGVYKISINPQHQLSLLKKMGAEFIAPTINEVAQLLRTVKKFA